MTCLHEAAHAVAAAALGFEDIWITVDPGTESYTEGRSHAPACNYTAPKSWSTETRAVRDVCVSYAGHMGEVLHGGPVLNGAGQDARAAEAMLENLPARRRAEVSDQCVTRTREILEARWSDVEWVAEMLEQHSMIAVEYEDGEVLVTLARLEPMPADHRAATQRRVQETTTGVN